MPFWHFRRLVEDANSLELGQFPTACAREAAPAVARMKRLERLPETPGSAKLQELLSQSQPVHQNYCPHQNAKSC